MISASVEPGVAWVILCRCCWGTPRSDICNLYVVVAWLTFVVAVGPRAHRAGIICAGC